MSHIILQLIACPTLTSLLRSFPQRFFLFSLSHCVFVLLIFLTLIWINDTSWHMKSVKFQGEMCSFVIELHEMQLTASFLNCIVIYRNHVYSFMRAQWTRMTTTAILVRCCLSLWFFLMHRLFIKINSRCWNARVHVLKSKIHKSKLMPLLAFHRFLYFIVFFIFSSLGLKN